MRVIFAQLHTRRMYTYSNTSRISLWYVTRVTRAYTPCLPSSTQPPLYAPMHYEAWRKRWTWWTRTNARWTRDRDETPVVPVQRTARRFRRIRIFIAHSPFPRSVSQTGHYRPYIWQCLTVTTPIRMSMLPKLIIKAYSTVPFSIPTCTYRTW